jgi:hypothetical protein
MNEPFLPPPFMNRRLMAAAKILYLDQNKWIQLARGQKSPTDHPAESSVLGFLVEQANAGRLIVPLTATNLYETHKINIKERRDHLAWVQSTLSQGMVFRGRYKRLEVEIIHHLRAGHGLERLPLETHWFLSNVFFECVAEIGDARIPQPSARVLEIIRTNPPRFMFEYLTELPEDIRTSAISKLSKGSEMLRQAIEEKRVQDAAEPLSMRRRLAGARLIINELNLVLSFIRMADLPDVDENAVLQKFARSIVNECPTYFVEREIGLRVEAQDRPIEENDFRDMQAFCAVVAYADILVAENMFSNVAVQAGLPKKYGTRVLTRLTDLLDAFCDK